jgi:protein gp37
MSKTSIEWADFSWNPIRADDFRGKTGWHCERVSEGCRNCYAEGINRRLGTKLEYKPGNRDALEIHVDGDTLRAPLKWKRPRRIFVCSMTDLFGDWVRDEMIDLVFAVMALCRQHTFQVLTKRSARMRAYMAHVEREAFWMNAVGRILEDRSRTGYFPILEQCEPWLPLPNVWLGVSAEDQSRADERIPDLLATPAAVRFVSLEPLLGEIDLTRIEAVATGCLKDGDFSYPKRINALTGEAGHYPGKNTFHPNSHRVARLNQVIVGGESGPNARPMHPDWPRKIRDDCAAAGVPFFFKQHGEWIGVPDLRHLPGGVGPGFGAYDHRRYDQEHEAIRVGKRIAGRLLDGVKHNGFPEVRI